MTPASLNALLTETYRPTPLVWTPWPERAGWWQAPFSGIAAYEAAYEAGKLLINADRSLMYLVIEDRGSSHTRLVVGPKDAP